MREEKKARVTCAYEYWGGVHVTFVYYGSETQKALEDVIHKDSDLYEKAKNLRPGDDVYADPGNCDSICRIGLGSCVKRLYVDNCADIFKRVKNIFSDD